MTDRIERERARRAACERAAVDWLRGLRNVDQLLAELVPREDRRTPPFPLHSRWPLQRMTPIPREIAERIFRVATDRRRPLERIDHLSIIEGVEERVLAHLINTGCSRLDDAEPEPTEPPEPDSDEERPENVIGVMLPVRIETRFGPGDRLRVRIVPDDPWFARHDPQPTETELEALEHHATTVVEDPDQAEAAWRQFASRVGGARAAWLQRTFDDRLDATGHFNDKQRPQTADDAPHWPRIVGFPDQLEVWLARGGNPAELVTTLEVAHDRLLADLPLPAPDADPDADPFAAAPPRWWSSFSEAEDVGLATTIHLGDRNDDIDVLYVIGVGGEEPRTLFADHRDAGQLGTIEPGTPTASVDGVPAAETVPNAETWSKIADGAQASEAQRDLSRALTGSLEELGRLPHSAGTLDGQRPENDPPGRSAGNTTQQGTPTPLDARMFVAALWPALWGHTLRDVLDLGPEIDKLADWAAFFLAPEGPFPALRIGNQPYGVLPVTTLSRWVSSRIDPQFEAIGLPAVTELRARMAAAAEAAGTVEGADADRLHDLLAQSPTSVAYQHRHEFPSELWFLLQLFAGLPVDWPEIADAWATQQELASTLGITPARRYGSIVAARDLELPLVLPEGMDAADLPDVINDLVRLAWEGGHVPFGSERIDEWITANHGHAPESLLLRLVIRSLQLAMTDVGMARAGMPSQLDSVAAAEGSHDLIARMHTVPPELYTEDTTAARAFRRVTIAVHELGQMDVVTLERRLRATLDCASHRIDPWITGLATRRMRQIQEDFTRQGQQPPMRLGAYGWVDRPRPGFTGPTEGGLLHAPSEPQVTAAAILRDRAVADPEPGRWDLNVDSTSARLAERLGDAVRDGLHLSEAVGAEVERLIEDRGRIDALRAAFPVRTEHAGRRVCDGLAVLDADPAALPLDGQSVPEGFAELRTALDTYADLLVAEAVYDVVDGRAETAGAAMDAAAGRARPPALDVLHTDREGTAIATGCVLILDDVPAPEPTSERPLAMLSPGTVAEPALAALVESHFGGPEDWEWELTHTTTDDEDEDDDADPNGMPTPETWRVDLSDLRLAPIDAVALSLADLERLVETAGGGRIVEASTPTDETHDSHETEGGRLRYARAAHLLDGLSHAPAEPQDLLLGDDRPVDHTAEELRQRLNNVRGVAVALIAAMDTADTESARHEVLVAASRWGIAPDPGRTEAGLEALVTRARDRLYARLDRAPREPGNNDDLPRELDATRLDPPEVADAIVALASGTGHLAVFSRLTGAELPDALIKDTGAITDEWLPTLADVRESLARLDTALLAEDLRDGAPLRAWSTRPDDPWQTAVIADEVDEASNAEPSAADARRLLVAFAPPYLDVHAPANDAMFAVSLVDRWSETVPFDHHTTAAAFGFDAPASRAPQAILLAVPPVPGAKLDTATCAEILAETRTLLRARMAKPGADQSLAALLPTTLLPASGPSAVNLNPTNGDET